MSQELKHYGTPRHSGRYPWGSGKDPYQSAKDFLGTVSELQKQGMSETEIAKGFGIKTSQLRARKTLAREEKWNADRNMVLKLHNKGMSNVAIGQRMGINESSVRSFLDPIKAGRAAITAATANTLRDSVEKYKYVDVGSGVEVGMGISRTKLNAAIYKLKEQGYKLHYIDIEQPGIPGQYTRNKILGGPDSSFSEVYHNTDLIQPVTGRSNDFGRTYKPPEPIKSMSSKKVFIRYAEEGGSDRDGLIELRRDVPDLDLKGKRYAQVRIGVDDTHFMKGMAAYSDNIPDGYDVVFNTNKKKGTPALGESGDTVLKLMKSDPDNPFGSSIGERRGVLNIVGSKEKIHEEGHWETWTKSISSQVLSKQPPALAKRQLEIAYKLKKEEFDEIQALTNPTVKKLLLNKFADGCDSDAVHLKAAAMPRQSTKLLMPVPDLKENEAYSTTYNNGEEVVLIRHPHGGPFEIAQLKINNKSPQAKAWLGDSVDAIGINPKVAKTLSGADFDGDSVLVIPNPDRAIRVEPYLKDLENFDPIEAYPLPKGKPVMKEQTKQTKMGEISNLITDMTIKHAGLDEIARAVKHSQVVIDAVKHELDYKRSYEENGIAALAEKYQHSKRGGASTLISKASSEERVPKRKAGFDIDPETGRKIYYETGETYVQKFISAATKKRYGIPENAKYKQIVSQLKEQGLSDEAIAGLTKEKTMVRTTKSTKMAEAISAHELSSGTPMETIYANHADKLKALGNTARKEAYFTKDIDYSPSAREVYNQEVKTLNAQLELALQNSPLERQAHRLTSQIVQQKMQSNPGLSTDKDALKKVRNQALADARARAGAKKHQIEITPKEWEAIQAGAISKTALTRILNNTDLDLIKKYATPRSTVSIPKSKLTRAQAMLSAGRTQAEVAQALGVSVSALVSALYK